MFGMVAEFLGDGVLMYASDYPHSECRFPNSVNNVPAWTSLERDTREKLLMGWTGFFPSRLAFKG